MNQKDKSTRPEARIVLAEHAESDEVIDQTPPIRLTAEEQGRFVGLLLDHPATAPAMERVKQAHAVIIRSR